MPPSSPVPREWVSSQYGLALAERLVVQVCWAWPDPTYLKRIRSSLTKQGIRAAVDRHDTPALFDWLVEIANYQGISDTIAWTYLEKHGRVQWADINAGFERGPSCPKLVSFDQFPGCNYRKSSCSCAHPEHLHACSLPTHPLRKGGLNRTAYSLYLFLRDQCQGRTGDLDRRPARRR